uniref:Major facilitator superfamily (MFS) profile domain-containing protein n=1 Tax=Tetradesmus obliquus TaxID=3088 RepID=A0A383WB59_TETOB|eukprot:jgi/Sobl393_1/16740/SZX74442.1
MNSRLQTERPCQPPQHDCCSSSSSSSTAGSTQQPDQHPLSSSSSHRQPVAQLDYAALQQAASAARADSKRKSAAAAASTTSTPAGLETPTTPKSSSTSSCSSVTGSQQGSKVVDVVINVSAKGPLGCKSIFQLYSNRQRALILAIVSLASVLVPLSDTVYLPALQPIQQEFATSQQLVASSVAVYMFAVGLAALCLGPASDRFGRRIVYLLSTLAFIATSLGCIFAPSIGLLVAFRALQGAAVAGYGATGSAIIADVYAPHERGAAMGISTIPMVSVVG